MALDGSGEATTLARACDVHQVTGRELGHVQRLAPLIAIGGIDPELAHDRRARRVLVEWRQLAGDGLGDTARRPGTELHGGVAVALASPNLSDRVRGSGNTLTGTTLSSSAKSRVMPSLRLDQPNRHSNSHLDLDVDARRQRELHQRIDRLR